MRSPLLASAALALLCFCADLPLAHASLLTGASVTGTIVPDSYGITVTNQFSSPQTVGSGNGFVGGIAGNGQSFDLNATFTDTGLNVLFSSTQAYDSVFGPNLFTLDFSDTAFAGTNFQLSSYGCNNSGGAACSYFSPPGELSGLILTGDTLELTFNGIYAGQTYSFAATPAVAPTPEPSGIFLLGTGLLGVAGMVRRRLTA